MSAQMQTSSSGKPYRPHAHHFASAEAEFQAAKQGMWVFLVTEVLMFGGLFVAYAIFRGMYAEMFKIAHHHLSIPLGLTNTIILITSSLTMALGVTATQKGEKSKALKFLSSTVLLACGFLIVKYIEYSHKFHDGLLPAGFFTNEMAKTEPKAPLFFSLYFVMTGLHGFHVIVGIGLILWIIKRLAKDDVGAHYFTPVELVGFYWHFVDLVWIYLFPLLYLVG